MREWFYQSVNYLGAVKQIVELTRKVGAYGSLVVVFTGLFICEAVWTDTAQAKTFNLAWDAPTTNEDGTPLTDLGGFEIHYGDAPGDYGFVDDVGNTTSAPLTISEPGTYYIAVLAYDTAPAKNLSKFSNELQVTVQASGSFSVDVALEAGIAAGKQYDVEVFDQGGSLLYSETLTADSQGMLSIPNTQLPANVELRIKSVGYLAVAVADWQVGTDSAFPALPAGDLDNNNIVNSGDWALLNAAWFQSDEVADLNDDGIANSADLLYLNANWFVIGD